MANRICRPRGMAGALAARIRRPVPEEQATKHSRALLRSRRTKTTPRRFRCSSSTIPVFCIVILARSLYSHGILLTTQRWTVQHGCIRTILMIQVWLLVCTSLNPKMQLYQ